MMSDRTIADEKRRLENEYVGDFTKELVQAIVSHCIDKMRYYSDYNMSLITKTRENNEELREKLSKFEEQLEFLQRENERKDNIIKSMEKNSTDLLMSNENLREKLSKSEDTNRNISRKLQNKNEEINMLKEEIEALKGE